jgi:hypothetical protein
MTCDPFAASSRSHAKRSDRPIYHKDYRLITSKAPLPDNPIIPFVEVLTQMSGFVVARTCCGRSMLRFEETSERYRKSWVR